MKWFFFVWCELGFIARVHHFYKTLFPDYFYSYIVRSTYIIPRNKYDIIITFHQSVELWRFLEGVSPCLFFTSFLFATSGNFSFTLFTSMHSGKKETWKRVGTLWYTLSTNSKQTIINISRKSKNKNMRCWRENLKKRLELYHEIKKKQNT